VENGITTVRFNLQWHKKGDIITMYNVYFYNDAAIMKPESKYELNCLLDMLKQNPSYIIKLHGHTNGNSPGKIIKLKPDDDHFFQITSNNEEVFGSAKELSLERAYTIKRYLIAHGISADRMTVKGWGGKKMIYNKNDPLAKRNVRVEVEIIAD
jgi:outer membrane protein OmpA-like peptidoglycan-associated protein